MVWDEEYDAPADWSETEAHLYGGMLNYDESIADDQFLQELFHEALFDDIHGHGGPEHDFLMDQLMEYLEREYGIDFDDVFDWDDWREWYEGG